MHKHGAVVVRSGNVLAKAANAKRNNPRNLLKTHEREHTSVHAEIAALKRVKNPQNCVIYIARLRRTGQPGLSKPCARCESALRKLGVKVVYTTD